MTTPIISDESALRAAVIAVPDDDAPRLIFADWIEERGRVEEAVFIRDQIAGLRPDPYWNKKGRIARAIMGGRLYDMILREWQDATGNGNPEPPNPPLHVEAMQFHGWIVTSSTERQFSRAIDGNGNSMRDQPARELPRIRVVIRRGFVEELTIPVDSWRYGANEFLTLHPLRRIQDFRPGSPGVYDVDLRDEHERIAQAKSKKHPPPEPVPILHVGGHLHGLRSPVQPNADSWKMPSVIRYPFAEMHVSFTATVAGRRTTPAEYRLSSIDVRSPAGRYREEIYVFNELTEDEAVEMLNDISNHEARRYIAASPRVR